MFVRFYVFVCLCVVEDTSFSLETEIYVKLCGMMMVRIIRSSIYNKQISLKAAYEEFFH